MVGPIYIIAIALGLAFFLGFFGKSLRTVSGFVMLAGLAVMAFISGQWLIEFLKGSITTLEVYTAGFKPPYAINLRMGLEEAAFTFMINAIGFLGGMYMFNRLKEVGNSAMSVFIVLIMSLNVIVMTRDLFNIFVFVEIGSIATAGMIILDKNSKSLQAGLKYLLATGVISGLLLIGIIFAYYFAGSLNIDDIISANVGMAKAGSVAVFLVIAVLVLELKPFPANGWGLDVYQSANPGFGAMVSAATATAGLFVLYKVLPMGGEFWYPYIVIIGLITFVGSNFVGTRQKNANRLLGYSSIGQIGLVMTVIGLQPILGDKFLFIAFTLLLNHYLAKAGLFWLSGIIKKDKAKDWSVLRNNKALLILFVIFIFALIGFPPFPSFFGKYELIMSLISTQNVWVAILILLGSFAEGIYMFRWLGDVLKNETHLEGKNIQWHKFIPIVIVGVTLLAAGFYSTPYVEGAYYFYYIPLGFIIFIGLIDFLPTCVKNTISIAGMAYYTYILYPLVEGDLMRTIFFTIFMIGGILTLIVGYSKKDKREGFYPVALMMYAGLAMILTSDNMFGFFFGWELMTAGSYFLIIRGKRSKPHAYSYMLFSIAGAYLILLGFAFAYASAGTQDLIALKDITIYTTLAYTLLAIGFMTKTASLGLHIWLPGAHGEAESDVSPMVSAVLLKAGVFGLMLLFLYMGQQTGKTLLFVLGWVGAFTALVGNLAAVFQEDAKRMLAYSSIGQLGYILFAIAMMTQLGWLAGFTYVINHFMFKAILFMVVGGIVVKTGTHNLYQMGGLLKKMPFSFVAVLIGIITLAGIPPLSGFAGKWLFYNAVVLKGWYIQGVIVFFAGTIAFMYAYKLIHSIFLGQLKDNHRNIKELSPAILIPVYILIAGIFYFSAYPQDVLEPIGNMLAAYFPSTVNWGGDGMVTTVLSYWNGQAVFIIIITVFVLVLGYLKLITGKTTKLEQFNIAYSAERPFKPETTHYSYNMFAGLNKAIGFIVAPGISRFWKNISEMVLDFAGVIRRLYSGNGQVYAVHIIIYIVVFYLVSLG